MNLPLFTDKPNYRIASSSENNVSEMTNLKECDQLIIGLFECEIVSTINMNQINYLINSS